VREKDMISPYHFICNVHCLIVMRPPLFLSIWWQPWYRGWEVGISAASL